MSKHPYTISATPHIRSSNSIDKTMYMVLAALAPATVLGVVFFGLRSLVILAVSVLSCCLLEAVYQKLVRRDITVTDGSAAVTGLLLGLVMPPGVPLWLPVVGALVAIVLVKQLFGGLGHNFINPALAGRCVLAIAYAMPMAAGFTQPFGSWLELDVVAVATPLSSFAVDGFYPGASEFLAAFIGNVSGSIGETSAVALLVGGVFLMFMKVISWHIPLVYVGTVFVLTFLLSGSFSISVAFYHVLTGGLIIGAFFMATDYPTSPITTKGKIIFAFGCGVLTSVIRLFGGMPEGVAYSILLMNLAVPLIDRFTRPRVLGNVGWVMKIRERRSKQ